MSEAGGPGPGGGHLDGEALCDLAEGLLAPSARRAAEDHLAACAECRRELEAVQGYFREMSGLGTVKAPDRFLTKVHARIAKGSPWRRLLVALSSPRLLPVPLTALSVLLVGGLTIYMSRALLEAEKRAAPLSGTAEEEAAPGSDRMARLAEPSASARAPAPAPVPEPSAVPTPPVAREEEESHRDSRPPERPASRTRPAEDPRAGNALADRGPHPTPPIAPPAGESEALALAAPAAKAKKSEVPARGDAYQADRQADVEAKAGDSRGLAAPVPRPPVTYVLTPAAGKRDSAALESALAALGIAVLRREPPVRPVRFELEVPPARIPELKVRLREFGALQAPELKAPDLPPTGSAAPLRLILQLDSAR